MQRKTVYLAGKIMNGKQGDWRGMLLGESYYEACREQSRLADGEDRLDWSRPMVDLGPMRVTGPFPALRGPDAPEPEDSTRRCSRISHRQDNVLASRPKDWVHGDANMYREAVKRECIRAIRRSDIIFAWVDADETAFGTLWELGYAEALGKSIVIFTPYAEPDLLGWGDHANTELGFGHLQFDPAIDERWMAMTGNISFRRASNPASGLEALVRELGRNAQFLPA